MKYISRVNKENLDIIDRQDNQYFVAEGFFSLPLMSDDIRDAYQFEERYQAQDMIDMFCLDLEIVEV